MNHAWNIYTMFKLNEKKESVYIKLTSNKECNKIAVN